MFPPELPLDEWAKWIAGKSRSRTKHRNTRRQ